MFSDGVCLCVANSYRWHTVSVKTQLVHNIALCHHSHHTTGFTCSPRAQSGAR
jgi:hypothetical protein